MRRAPQQADPAAARNDQRSSRGDPTEPRSSDDELAALLANRGGNLPPELADAEAIIDEVRRALERGQMLGEPRDFTSAHHEAQIVEVPPPDEPVPAPRSRTTIVLVRLAQQIVAIIGSVIALLVLRSIF
jgi:hypothetical protein